MSDGAVIHKHYLLVVSIIKTACNYLMMEVQDIDRSTNELELKSNVLVWVFIALKRHYDDGSSYKENI